MDQDVDGHIATKGQIVVDVHQIVRDNDGNLLSEQDVQHVYSFKDGLAVAMDVYHDGALASAPRTSTRD
jgi:hypothetical protein